MAETPAPPTLRPAKPYTRLSLRLPERAITTASHALDLDLSLPINRATTNGSRSALRLSPDEWLILTALSETVTGALAQALPNQPYSAVDISHRQTALIIETSHAAAILNALCPLDLDNSTFPPGTATRTLFGKAEIVLWRHAPDQFHLEIWRSYAPYVAALLSEIGREYQD